MSLKNITTEMSGYYICTSRNEVGEKSCNITVAVRPRKSSLGVGGGRRVRGVDEGQEITGLGCEEAAERDPVEVSRGSLFRVTGWQGSWGDLGQTLLSQAPLSRGQSCSLGSLEEEPQTDFWRPGQSCPPLGLLGGYGEVPRVSCHRV